MKLPLEFRRKQTADLTGWHGNDEHPAWQMLMDGISSKLKDHGVIPSRPVGISLVDRSLRILTIEHQHAMKLIESDERLVPAARDFEVHAAQVQKLEGLELAVVLTDFLNLNASQKAYLDTNAAYQLSTETILINPPFLELAPLEQRGILAHEVAHAIDHRDGLLEKLPSQFKIGLHPEEFLADWLACSWGFLDAVSAMRNSWGTRYVANLELWNRESDYYVAMNRWNLQRSAGINQACLASRICSRKTPILS